MNAGQMPDVYRGMIQKTSREVLGPLDHEPQEKKR